MVRAGNLLFPTVVMEAGCSEAWVRLTDDMKSGLVGGNGDVKENRALRPRQGIRRSVFP